MKENAIALISGLIFLLTGIILLFWPEKVQQYYLNYYEKHATFARLNPFLRWMQTSSYVASVMVVGALSLAGGIFLLLFFVRNIWS
jgi:uncharacterized membrane protein HdeD (DUF308 family)